MKKDIQQIIIGVKIFFFLFILTTPFIPSYYLQIVNNQFYKIIFLCLIIAAAFLDISLAILMTITFLILMISANKDKINKIKSESFSSPRIAHTAETIYNSTEMTEVVNPPIFETMVKIPEARCNDMRFYKDQISTDMFDIYIDEKIKPYEEYMRKLTSPSQLDLAQSNEISF